MQKVGYHDDCTDYEYTTVNVGVVNNIVKITQPLVLINIPIKPDEEDNHLCVFQFLLFLTF